MIHQIDWSHLDYLSREKNREYQEALAKAGCPAVTLDTPPALMFTRELSKRKVRQTFVVTIAEEPL